VGWPLCCGFVKCAQLVNPKSLGRRTIAIIYCYKWPPVGEVVGHIPQMGDHVGAGIVNVAFGIGRESISPNGLYTDAVYQLRRRGSWAPHVLLCYLESGLKTVIEACGEDDNIIRAVATIGTDETRLVHSNDTDVPVQWISSSSLSSFKFNSRRWDYLDIVGLDSSQVADTIRRSATAQRPGRYEVLC
jgi:hypothetical protein